jgi:hypothetical protein
MCGWDVPAAGGMCLLQVGCWVQMGCARFRWGVLRVGGMCWIGFVANLYMYSILYVFT